jgi:hypothetical protein
MPRMNFHFISLIIKGFFRIITGQKSGLVEEIHYKMRTKSGGFHLHLFRIPLGL